MDIDPLPASPSPDVIPDVIAAGDVAVRLSGEASESARARSLMRTFAPSLTQEELEDALVIVSELVSNAIVHGRDPRWLHLRLVDSVMNIIVGDGATELPMMRTPDARRQGGLGMTVVERLSAGWGVHERPDGKDVWCTMAVRAPRRT